MAFADTEPGRWGRTVIRQAHVHGLLKADCEDPSVSLLAANDVSRVGSFRFFEEDEQFCKSEKQARPAALPQLKQLLSASRRLELGRESEEDAVLLLAGGTSLGGARPKCAVSDENGVQYLAKFPSMKDRRDVQKGEVLALLIAARAGMDASEARIRTTDGLSVSLIRRFDRNSKTGDRIPYRSLATFLNQTDPEVPVCYADLAAKLLEEDETHRLRIGTEILKRLYLNVLLNNTDDHERNTAVLGTEDGRWRLSPLFDVNPEPLKRPSDPYASKTLLSREDGPVTSVAQLTVRSGLLGLSKPESLKALAEVVGAVRSWKSLASDPRVRMTKADVARYARAFENDRVAEASAILKAA